MLYNAKNGTLKIGGSEMDYIRFGTGGKILVMLTSSCLSIFIAPSALVSAEVQKLCKLTVISKSDCMNNPPVSITKTGSLFHTVV